MAEFAMNFLGGIVGGVISTGVFLLLMNTFGRPKLVISPEIAKRDGVLRIKVINRSRFDLFDVQAELKLITPPTPPRRRPSTSRISLLSEEYMGFRKYDPNDDDFEFSLVFLTDSEDTAWKELDHDKHLRFRIHASHGLTGFRKMFEQKYMTDSIREGDFEKGNTFDIAP